MFPCVPTNGDGLNLALKSRIYNENDLKIKFVVRDTFLTIKNDKNLKADHDNIASIVGKLNHSNNSIIWK